MGGSDLTVLVVDDDFRVAELHASVVAAVAGFRVAAVAGTLAEIGRAHV